MNKILFQSGDKKTTIVIKEVDARFHGKLVIHFAHGVPKKKETNDVEDIVMST